MILVAFLPENFHILLWSVHFSHCRILSLQYLFSILTWDIFVCSAFGQLLDDSPLVTGELSSSVLTATAFHPSGHGEKGLVGEPNFSQEVEKGLLLLIASDTPGLQA